MVVSPVLVESVVAADEVMQFSSAVAVLAVWVDAPFEQGWGSLPFGEQRNEVVQCAAAGISVDVLVLRRRSHRGCTVLARDAGTV